MPAARETRSTLRHARIAPERLHEFFDRVELLAEEFTTLPRDGDVVYGFIAAIYPTTHPVLPEVATPSPDATLATVAAVPTEERR